MPCRAWVPNRWHHGQVRFVAVCLCLLLAVSCSSSSSVNETDVADLRAEVDELKAALASSTESEIALQAKVEELQARLTRSTQAASAGQQAIAWPDDYQKMWVEICAAIMKGAVEADPLAGSAQDICACSLKGLMKAFTLREYESWGQELKDAAAAPYVTICWSL